MERQQQRKKKGSLRNELWDKRLILGVPSEEDQFAQEKNGQLQISAVAYKEAHGMKAKAEYLTDLIDGLAEGKIPKGAPKQCPPPGSASINHLDPPQLVPKMLITPESPLRRLLVVQPPGSGKTCIMIDILANFLDLPYKIIIVGDADIFLSVQSNLRKCPAKVGAELLRERDPKAPDWCVLNSNAKQNILPEDHRLHGCSDSFKFKNATIYWLDYVRFGNWLDTSSPQGNKARKKTSKYGDSPFTENTLILMDEVHKLAVPSDEQATARWKVSALYVGKQLFQAGRDPATNPIVVGFTATPIIDDPAQVICLATVFKGHTDPGIFKDAAMTQLRVPPKSFYDPAMKFVQEVKDVTILEPGTHGKYPRKVPIRVLQNQLKENRCIQAGVVSNKDQTTKKGGSLKAAALAGHPCPVGESDRAKAVTQVYRLTEAAVQPLVNLFSNLFFVVNSAADPRKFPEMLSRQRLVPAPPGYKEAIGEGMTQGDASWAELSNFANPRWLKGYVRRRLIGHEHTQEDTEMIEANAPKWKALARDLTKKATLGGKTAVYVGAKSIEGVCSSSDFLFGLGLYLRHAVGYSDGTTESFNKMNQEEAESRSSSYNSEDSKQGPPLFIFADKTPDILMPKKAEGREVYRPQDLPLLAGNEEFRKQQLSGFNAAPCTGEAGGSTASDYAIILLGYEAYKAIDLECASNMVRLVVQPHGRGEQTYGRARRSCSFRRVADTSRWMVNLLTYVIEDPSCQNYDCDCILGSFFNAQAQLQEEILGLVRGCSIGCTNFKEFSQWSNPVHCILDAKASGKTSSEQEQRQMYYCSFDGAPGASPPPAQVKRGTSGDVSMDMVLETAGSFCDAHHLAPPIIPSPSANDHLASASSGSHRSATSSSRASSESGLSATSSSSRRSASSGSHHRSSRDSSRQSSGVATSHRPEFTSPLPSAKRRLSRTSVSPLSAQRGLSKFVDLQSGSAMG